MEASVDVIKAASDPNAVLMTVRVKRIKEFRFRCWLGLIVMRLAVWILPFTVKVEDA